MAEVLSDRPVDPALSPLAEPARRSARRQVPAMAVVRDVEGPRVSLGVVWFVVVLVATMAASVALGLVLAVAAALAAGQVVGLRAADGPDAVPHRFVARLVALPRALVTVIGDLPRLTAALGAAALPLAAVAGPDTVAAAAAATVAMALVVVLVLAPPPSPSSALDPESRPGQALVRCALVVVVALAFGGGAAGVVLLRGEGVAAAVTLVLLVSVYEAGDFLVGAGSEVGWEGPLAGTLAVVVVALGASLLALAPLGQVGPLVLAGVVVTCAPLGPPAASVLLGGGSTPARFVRRLDVWLLVGPLASWAAIAAATT